jgi:hypothetical protein
MRSIRSRETIADHELPTTLMQSNAAAIGASAMTARSAAGTEANRWSEEEETSVLQHFIGPVLHEPPGGEEGQPSSSEPPRATGVTEAATLLTAAKAMTKETRDLWNNIAESI